MFKKLVSNLPFSPSLVGQLGFYARRLKKEEALRRLGLIFTAFALIIQSVAVFNPPESANAANATDMCPGVTANAAGAKKIKDCYNNNTRHYKDILTFFGITKDKLWKALDGKLSFRSTSTYKSWYTFGHVRRNSNDKDYSGQVPGNLYGRIWNMKNGQYGWSGNQGDTDFLVLSGCGNLVLKRLLNPSAKCVSLTASKQELTAGDSVTLTAKASTSDGAGITKYNFTQTGPAAASGAVATSNKSATWKSTLSKAGTYKFSASVNSSVGNNITSNGCTATVVVKEKVVPKAVCEDLTVIPTSGKRGTTFKITGKASVSGGASIKQYNFTAKGPANYSWSNPTTGTTSTWSLTPEKAGTYGASVSVDTSLGAVTAPACNASFTVTEVLNPSAECKLLSVEQLSRTQYKLSATASTADGATVSGYSHVVKDAAGKTVKQSGKISNNSWTVELPDNTSLTESAKYTAIVTVHTSLGDKTSEECQKPISIPPLEKCEYNPELPVGHPDCKPADCETNPEMEGCGPEIELIKTAINKTQNGQDATTVTADGGDVIAYIITITNHGKSAGSIQLDDMLVDTLDYATVTDTGGANFDETTKTLSWGEVTVDGGASTTRTFVVTVNNPVPSTAQNHGTPESYDCVMTNAIAENEDAAVSIPVNCPVVKEVVEQTIIKQLPATGAGDNILFGGIVAAIVVFFYARSRQLGKEVRLVRREFNAGTL